MGKGNKLKLKRKKPKKQKKQSESESDEEESKLIKEFEEEIREAQSEKKVKKKKKQKMEAEQQIDSDMEIFIRAEQQKAKKNKNEEDIPGIQRKTQEIVGAFYKRLLSKNAIKEDSKRIPWIEHLSFIGGPLQISKNEAIHDDVRRQMAFANIATENLKKSLRILIQSKTPIKRPDDFYAQMFKSDKHMAKVKHSLIKQQVRIQNFQEKKQRKENKRFAKAIKDFKNKEKSQEKRKSMHAIQAWKQELKRKGGDAILDEPKKHKKRNYLQMLKNMKKEKRIQSNTPFKKKNHKRPGKNKRQSLRSKKFNKR